MIRVTSSFGRVRSWLPPLGAALFLAASLPLSARAQTSVFTPLGDLPGGAFRSFGRGVSADGRVVVGNSSSSASGADAAEAFRWTAATGMVSLNGSGGAKASTARGVSADGSVVVGEMSSANGPEAFRWTADSGLVGLGDLPGLGFFSSAYAVSADGLIVVGHSSRDGNNGGGFEAFRWTVASGITGLGDLSGGPYNSIASAISPNGGFIVGRGAGYRGYEATRNGEGLGGLPGGPESLDSAAYGVSADGTVVGESSGPNVSGPKGKEAFRWTSATGMVRLGVLPGGGFSSAAYAISADSSVIVGVAQSADGNEAFRWTQATGMVSLKQYLLDNYASSLPADFSSWKLMDARAVSADGAVIVGSGIDPNGNTQAYRVRLAPLPTPVWTPIDVAVNPADNTSRLLWRHSDGHYAVWKTSASGVIETGKNYGPVAGYTCEQIAVGPNGDTTLLWKNPGSGRTALWTLASDLSSIVKATVYNNPAEYAPQNIAVDAQNRIRMTLRRTNGQVVFWTINATSGAITTTSGRYGPYANLQDGPIAVGADGFIRMLWRNTSTGQATVWNLPSAYGDPYAGYRYGPVAGGALASDLSVGADNKTRLQWTYPNGKIALWKLDTVVNGSGGIDTGKFYGPFSGVTPLGIATGGDNQTRQLWKYTTGKAALWVLNDPLTSISTAYTYGPIY